MDVCITYNLRFSDGKFIVLPRRIQKDISFQNIEPKVFKRIHL